MQTTYCESEYILTSRKYIDNVDHYQGIEYVDTETSDVDPLCTSTDFNSDSYYFTKI